MHVPKQIHLRDTRDRLVEALELGEPYPLQDVEVLDQQLTVPVDSATRIRLDPGQIDVRYKLHGPDDAPIRGGPGKRGSGGETVLDTPDITHDITFKIRATKEKRARDEDERAAYLHHSSTVKVGLDSTLRAEILAPLLNALVEGDSAPRIVDFGTQVEVAVHSSQEGVDYSIWAMPSGSGGSEISESEVRGNRGTITLRTTAVSEDTVLRVRATRRFDPTDNLPDDVELLDVELPLKVRADPDLVVRADPSAIVALGGGAFIAVEESQASVEYRLHARPLEDWDFRYGSVDAAEVVSVPVPGEPDAAVVRPTEPRAVIPTGYTPVGTSRAGNGGELRLPITGGADSLVVVEARKTHEHTAGEAHPATDSALRLDGEAVILVQPDPAAGLELQIPAAGSSFPGTVIVTAGEPGVSYQLRRGATGAPRGLPAYFHKRDALNDSLNKGVRGDVEGGPERGLRVEVDFALIRDRPPVTVGAVEDPRTTPPLDPVVELGALPLGIDLHVRARKARSGVSVPMARVASVPPLPAMLLESDAVAIGGRTRIVVEASVAGERYRPFVDGVPLRAHKNGNGGRIAWQTDPITEETTFHVHVTRPADSGIPVTRIVALTATIAPGA